jgi:hypothetical protein
MSSMTEAVSHLPLTDGSSGFPLPVRGLRFLLGASARAGDDVPGGTRMREGLRGRRGYFTASARRGRITARVEAAMAAATITTKNSMTSLAAKYSVATPRIITGTVSPTYAPR